MTTRLALVTGGNGFVGCHVVRALLARGDRVRVLARENADLSALAGLPVEILRGDLRYFDSVERAVNGCNEVYHVAADYRLWLTDPAPMYATNVAGTEHVIRAATSANVSRIIYTSTVGALGIPHAGVGREDTPSSLAEMPVHYKSAKYMLDQVALGYALGAEAFARTVPGRAARASLTEVRMARKRMVLDSSKARAELGYSPGPIDAAIGAAIEFFRSKGTAKSAA